MQSIHKCVIALVQSNKMKMKEVQQTNKTKQKTDQNAS